MIKSSLAILLLSVVSFSVVAGEYKPAFELNVKQMDVITAGFDAEAIASAFSEGLVAASNAETATLIEAGEEGTFLVSVGGAQAAGDDGAGTGAEATTNTGDLGGAPSFTFDFSMDDQGNFISNSGAVEFTFVPTVQ